MQFESGTLGQRVPPATGALQWTTPVEPGAGHLHVLLPDPPVHARCLPGQAVACTLLAACARGSRRGRGRRSGSRPSSRRPSRARPHCARRPPRRSRRSSRAQTVAERLSTRADEIERALQGLAESVRDGARGAEGGPRGAARGRRGDRRRARGGGGDARRGAPARSRSRAGRGGGEPAPAEDAPAKTAPPDPCRGRRGHEGARVIALNMALNGSSREETAHYLSENFELDDPGALLDEVYARSRARSVRGPLRARTDRRSRSCRRAPGRLPTQQGASYTIPTPTSVNSGRRMFARWPGLSIQPSSASRRRSLRAGAPVEVLAHAALARPRSRPRACAIPGSTPSGVSCAKKCSRDHVLRVALRGSLEDGCASEERQAVPRPLGVQEAQDRGAGSCRCARGDAALRSPGTPRASRRRARVPRRQRVRAPSSRGRDGDADDPRAAHTPRYRQRLAAERLSRLRRARPARPARPGCRRGRARRPRPGPRAWSAAA